MGWLWDEVSFQAKEIEAARDDVDAFAGRFQAFIRRWIGNEPVTKADWLDFWKQMMDLQSLPDGTRRRLQTAHAALVHSSLEAYDIIRANGVDTLDSDVLATMKMRLEQLELLVEFGEADGRPGGKNGR